MDSVYLSSALVGQAASVAEQFLELPLRAVRDVAGSDQSVTCQIADPLRILDVSLASRDALDVFGVNDLDLHTTELEEVVDRLPVHAGALHGHESAISLREPESQHSQLAGRGLIGPDLHLAISLQAGHNRSFVNVHSTTATMQHVQCSGLLGKNVDWSDG